MTKPCVVNCDNLRAVSSRFLVERIAALSAGRHAEVKRAVGYALGWRELMDIPL
jgi:mRNA-degrading endonuclease toxin of MazEF toxin-antitoxin module